MASGPSNSSFRLKGVPGSALIPLLLGLVFLWWRLLDNLQMEWTLNPQYNYGWAVPFLSIYLLLRQRQQGEGSQANLLNPSEGTSRWLIAAFAGLAFLYAPTRLVEESSPDWRIVGLTLAIEVVGLTLLAVRFVGGSRLLKQSAFAICFILVAVPWLTVIEGPVIQGLSRSNAAVAIELLSLFNVAAIQHGNVIEVATGLVGVDDACSGIRSLQAALMISLFLGEYHRLNVTRRIACVLAGFVLSFAFNIARTSLLVWVAASKGIPAIDAWHDPAGITILVGCFCGVWAVGLWLKRGNVDSKNPVQNDPPVSAIPSPTHSHWKALGVALCAWLLMSEIGIEWWYRTHEARLKPNVQWTITLPTNNPTLKMLPFPEDTRRILRFNEGKDATWMQDGIRWQVFFLRWEPGRIAPLLSRNHTPEVCLEASGADVISVSELKWFVVHGLQMPFRRYEVMVGRTHLDVFYCLWNDLANTQGFGSESLTYGNRLEPVLTGLRNPGQRSIEIAVWNAKHNTDIDSLLQQQLESLIVTP